MSGLRVELSEPEAKDWLGQYGIQTPPRKFASTADECVGAFGGLRSPVAVKLVSGAIHKSDIGGVHLGIRDKAALEKAIASIASSATARGIRIDGYLIEEMAPGGLEILVGGVVDPVFGPAVVVGLGGIHAEVFDDIATRICPISPSDAFEMIQEFKAAPLLFGARGGPSLDVKALAEILVAIGSAHGLLVEHADRIQEIDLNPVIVSQTGAVAVDARIVMRQAPGCG
jgi:acetyl-CoA synthetase (ADP-forming)